MGIDIEELSRRSSWAPEQVEELKASRLDLHTVDAERLGAAAMALVDAGYLTAGARACLRLLAAPRIDGRALTLWARSAYRSLPDQPELGEEGQSFQLVIDHTSRAIM